MTSKNDLRVEFDAIVQQLAADLEQGMLSSLTSKKIESLDALSESQPKNSEAMKTTSTDYTWSTASASQHEETERNDLTHNAGKSSTFTNSLQSLLVNSSKAGVPSQSSTRLAVQQPGVQNRYGGLLSQPSLELGSFLQPTQESILQGLFNLGMNSGSSSVLPAFASQGAQRSVNPLRWLTSPLVAGLGWLFGKGDNKEPITPSLATLPRRMSLDAGYDRRDNQLVAIAGSAGGLSRSAATESNNIQPNITIQVNALDTRSFVDHSSEIAQALRKAMLESHSINDMLAEL